MINPQATLFSRHISLSAMSRGYTLGRIVLPGLRQAVRTPFGGGEASESEKEKGGSLGRHALAADSSTRTTSGVHFWLHLSVTGVRRARSRPLSGNKALKSCYSRQSHGGALTPPPVVCAACILDLLLFLVLWRVAERLLVRHSTIRWV